PQANETPGGVVVELVARLVGRQFLAVQAVLALAADRRGLALEELHPHDTANETLVTQYEMEQVLMKGAEPQSIINYIRILLRNHCLETLRLFAQAQRLQLAMGVVENHRRRRLVQLTRLDADQPVLDVVDPADAVFAAELVQTLDQGNAVHFFPVQSCR